MRNGNYDEALDLEAFVAKLATMHPRYLPPISFEFVIVENVRLVLIVSWMDRLPVIQSLADDVGQTTKSLLAQILQRLRSNIQVGTSSDTGFPRCCALYLRQ